MNTAFFGLASPVTHQDLVPVTEWTRRADLLSDGRVIHQVRNILTCMCMLEETTRTENGGTWSNQHLQMYLHLQNRIRNLLYTVRAHMRN
jgi:hypothetical protein